MPGTSWVLNHAGFRLSDDRLSDIPYPYFELYFHVTTKTVQTGALIGTCFVGPSIALYRGQRDRDSIKTWAEKSGKYGVGIGILAGPLTTWAMLHHLKASPDSVWDICYRMRHNRGQVRADQLTFIGALAGCAAATYLGESAGLGALVGVNTGILLAAVLHLTIGKL